MPLPLPPPLPPPPPLPLPLTPPQLMTTESHATADLQHKTGAFQTQPASGSHTFHNHNTFYVFINRSSVRKKVRAPSRPLVTVTRVHDDEKWPPPLARCRIIETDFVF
jgi:hypothetical protein